METNGLISAAEASAALESVQRSREHVAWTGYPTWYWLTTALGLAAMPFILLLPGSWDVAGGVVLTALLAALALRTSRIRGVFEGCTRSAMRWRDRELLYGPPVAAVLTDAVAWRFGWWSPVPAAVASAVLAFALFTATALTLSARATRR